MGASGMRDPPRRSDLSLLAGDKHGVPVARMPLPHLRLRNVRRFTAQGLRNLPTYSEAPIPGHDGDYHHGTTSSRSEDRTC